MSGDPDAPILVIKLSSLGDFLMCLGAFKAIRAHHGEAKIVLLTTEPYAGLGQACGCFDEVWRDRRPRPLDPAGWWRLAGRLRRARFRRVYDLQLSQRTGWYFRLLGPRAPEWVGGVPGCSHRYLQPATPRHIMERHAEMLALAGIGPVPAPDLSFLEADLGRFELPESYALLAPGSSPNRKVKRWPVERYGALAVALAARGLTPVVIGGEAEREAGAALVHACPQALDLCGRTEFAEVSSLARGAAIVVGNDTGPLHLAALSGAPVVALFSRESDPAKARPPGPVVTVLHRNALVDLPAAEVLEAVDRTLRSG